MEGVIVWLKACLTAVWAGFGYFVGGFDGLLITLLVFMIVDYITGVIGAIKNKKLSSKTGFMGLGKKVVILLLVGSVNLLGIAMNIEGLRYIVISFYVANEGISILENASVLNIPIPQAVKDILEQLKKEEKK